MDGPSLPRGTHGAMIPSVNLWPDVDNSPVQYTRRRVITVQNPGDMLVEYDNRRMALLILSTGAVSIVVGEVNGGQYTLGTTTPLILTWPLHGPLVYEAWFAVSAAISDLTISEVFYERSLSRRLSSNPPPVSRDSSNIGYAAAARKSPSPLNPVLRTANQQILGGIRRSSSPRPIRPNYVSGKYASDLDS